ncbi:hypothetical protein KKH23_10350, partial [Patescibacteria group bacterium]|nr:hypothetical protein [Patescibacteria group bacterium]
MKKYIDNRIKSMLIVATMLLTALTVITVSSTTVTNNNAPESTPLPGDTDVFVMDFTLTDAGTDTVIAGATPTSGTILSATADADWQGITTAGTVSYYDAVEGGAWNSSADAIWEEVVADDKYTAGDTLLAGTAPDEATVETGDGGKDTDWTTIKLYDDTGTDFWDVTNDAIIEEIDGNNAYHDSLDSITITNPEGTADGSDISAVSLWAEDSTTSGFQNDEDTHLGETTLGVAIDNIYQIIPPAGQRFYVTVNLSNTSTSADTIKMRADVTLNSTDVIDTFENSNTQTIGKLGVDYFEGTEEGAVDVIITDTQNLKYGVTMDIVVDTSQLTSTAPGNIYYLYRPYYVRTGTGGSYEYELQWKAVMTGGGEQVSIDGSKTSDTMQSISLDYAGMWILDNDNNPSDASNGSDDDFAYFWVSNSNPYTIEYTPSSIYYGKNETVQIIVKEEGETVEAWIDVIRESDDSRVFHTWESDGTFSFNSDWLNNLSYAGNYTIKAYTDVDDTKIGYGVEGYSEDYGYTNPHIGDENYSALCGPWDPYEKNGTEKTIRVETGVPTAVAVAGNNTMYWGFSGEVNITIVGYDGEDFMGVDADDMNVKAFNDEDEDITSEASLTIDSDNIDKGYIRIDSDSWGKDDDHSYGENGTWYVYIYLNKDDDVGANEYVEEWNTTVEWTVAAAPSAQFKWINDDGTVGGVDLWGSQKSNNDGIIPYVPTADFVPLDVEFYVYGEDGSYFGDVVNGLQSGKCAILQECAANITISGNSLFTGKLSDFPGYGLDMDKCGFNGDLTGVWSIPIVPTMSLAGGEITIKVTAFGSSISETISIGGENYGAEGSIVSVTPNDFMIDQENKILTI